jgi:hypothetical protein
LSTITIREHLCGGLPQRVIARQLALNLVENLILRRALDVQTDLVILIEPRLS